MLTTGRMIVDGIFLDLVSLRSVDARAEERKKSIDTGCLDL